MSGALRGGAEVRHRSCGCAVCASMCRAVPCWGTPKEMARIIAAGYGRRLMAVRNRSGFVLAPGAFYPEFTGREFPEFNRIGQVTSDWDVSGQCTFLTAGGRCELHDLGLKPVEGRAAIHDGPGTRKLRERLRRMWRRPGAQDLVRKWERSISASRVQRGEIG